MTGPTCKGKGEGKGGKGRERSGGKGRGTTGEEGREGEPELQPPPQKKKIEILHSPLIPPVLLTVDIISEYI